MWRRMEDLTGIGKAAEAVERITREGRELMAAFLQPGMRELGEWVAQNIRFYRERSALKLLQLADEQVRASGLPRVPLTLKETVVLLEGASLEEDEYLTSRWAGLIATAATVGGVLPAFADILRQLSPEEARMLDFVATEARDHAMIANAHCVEKGQVRAASGLELEAFVVRIQNLHRLELVVEVSNVLIGNQPVRGAGGWSGDGDVGLTTFGLAFVRACRGPAPMGPT